MENDATYFLEPANSDLKPGDVYRWWDCAYDDFEKQRKKKKSSKRKKKSKKHKGHKLKYKLIEKAADVALSTSSDIIKMYFENKFR